MITNMQDIDDDGKNHKLKYAWWRRSICLQIQNNQLLCIIYFNLCVHLKAFIIFTDADNCDLVEHMCVWSVHTLRTAKVEDTHSNGPWKHWALSSSTSACVLWIIIIVMYFFVEFFFWRLIFSFFLFVLLLFTYRNWTLFNSQRFNAQLNCLNSALIAIFLFLFRSCALSPHTVEVSDNRFFFLSISGNWSGTFLSLLRDYLYTFIYKWATKNENDM